MRVNEKHYMKICIFIPLVTIFFFILSFSFQKVWASKEVSVMEYGATSNDTTDDTAAIQQAIDRQSASGGGVVYFPKGNYLVDAVSSIVAKDNITLKFEEGAVLEALPNDKEHHQVIRIHDVNDVKIVGKVEIRGERDLHTGTTGEWGMGISIRGSTNVLVENVRVNKMWGDGIYVGSTEKQRYSENVEIVNPVLDKNRRQGISVISAKNLEIKNAKISDTRGTSPQCGIDIEPSHPNDVLENINIINLTTNNNEGSGLKIYLKKYTASSKPISIYIDSLKGVKDGFAIRETESAKGEVRVGDHPYMTEKDVDRTPIVKEILDTSSVVTGTVQINSLITIKAGDKQIGTGRSTSDGTFKVEMPKQTAGTTLSITATDLKGKTGNVVKKVVESKLYQDVNLKHWAYNEIKYMNDKKIVTGYPNGSFQPNNYTTRAEAAKMLAAALGLPIKDTPSGYKDVSNKHWAKDYIAAVSKAGLFIGNPDGTFAPDNVLKRSEMAKVISIAYELDAGNKNHFKDVKSGHWAKGYISGLYENGITTGFPDKTFRPGASTTRAEYSVFLARALNEDFR